MDGNTLIYNLSVPIDYGDHALDLDLISERRLYSSCALV